MNIQHKSLFCIPPLKRCGAGFFMPVLCLFLILACNHSDIQDLPLVTHMPRVSLGQDSKRTIVVGDEILLLDGRNTCVADIESELNKGAACSLVIRSKANVPLRRLIDIISAASQSSQLSALYIGTRDSNNHELLLNYPLPLADYYKTYPWYKMVFEAEKEDIHSLKDKVFYNHQDPKGAVIAIELKSAEYIALGQSVKRNHLRDVLKDVIRKHGNVVVLFYFETTVALQTLIDAVDVCHETGVLGFAVTSKCK